VRLLADRRRSSHFARCRPLPDYGDRRLRASKLNERVAGFRVAIYDPAEERQTARPNIT
jgi:hypothetical protein